ncbi:SpaH/EbpB family LPXTG-anchored major pilin [uncultured Corynebacterium sp.]|uniref:SpaH/EbpB family LPXTG-anchored major pilin n=1 Tax=uncultured Corynebacterium sp. TaxID=159447 RepID=UPI0025EE493D|nr:SpaH/EbpB family LPXTG-anchored major pilin [uncultured Corynebacterium sp.]
MQNNTRFARSATFAAILGLTMTTGALGAVAPMAYAQPPTVSNIDEDATGSITIHKRAGVAGTARDDGNEIEGQVPGDPLQGATFSVQQVEADLTTNEGFAAARALTPGEANPIGEATEATTDGEGVANFGELPVGVYLVTETGTPEGYIGSAPFLVFVPMTNPDNTAEWNYNVHVSPKNTEVDEPVKTVTDADQNVGDAIDFTITSTIPAIPEGGTLQNYRVTDDLDETRVATAADRVTVTLENTTVELAAGDYTVNVNEATQAVEVVFTESGLTKLTQARNAQGADPVQVITTINADVLPIGDDITPGEFGGDLLVNEANVIVNNGSGGGDVTTPTNEVESYLGKLQVNKTNEEGGPLAGADFQLYRCTDQANLTSDPLTVAGQDTWTTDANGRIVIDGLRVTDFENGAENQPTTKKYCLVETEAPSGYELLPDPVEVDFTRADLAEVNTEDDDAVTRAVEIENVTSTGPNLPLTGGAGIGLIALLGALLVGAGAWWAKRNASQA